MFCPNCGNQLSDGAKFCGSCGASIGARALRPVVPSEGGAQAYPAKNAVVAGSTTQTSITQGNVYTSPQVGDSARQMKTDRGLLKYLVFTILTLGIYSFYFIYKMAQDMNVMCSNDREKTGGLLAFLLLSFLTLGIYTIYWWYKVAERVYLNAPYYGITVTEKGSSYLLWWILGLFTFGIGSLVGTHIVIKNVNYLAAAYNRQHGFV